MIGNLPKEEPTRSPWAVIIIFIVALLFGFFWFRETEHIKESYIIPVATMPGMPTPKKTNELDLNTIEASAVNIAIPSFEELF